MIRPERIVLLGLAAGIASAGEMSNDSENWLRLERTSEQSRQQLRAQQSTVPETTLRKLPRAVQDDPLVPSLEESREMAAPQTDEQLFQQQQIQQQGLQEQQRRALISGQHRQQALPPGNRGADRSYMQQQQFNMQQQNQLRGFQLQQQIQRGITR